MSTNTIKKGDAFEERIFKILESEIENDRYFIKKSWCKIFRKKGYYSHDRKSNIIFDVSIEVTRPGEEQYSLLVLVECKDYKGSVPVNDVEEFYSKILQVTGVNAKGIFACTSSFQEGARNFAKSKGFALIRCFEPGGFKWELDRSQSASLGSGLGNWAMINQGISQNDFKSPVFDLFCEYRLTLTNSLWEFSAALFREEKESLSWFFDCLNQFSSPPKIVPFLEPRVVENTASQVLLDHGYSSGHVDLERVCEEEKARSGLDVVFYEKLEVPKNSLLGSIDFDAMKIKIYRQEKEYKPRERFTLAHELGHYFMKHDEYMRGEYLDDEDDDSIDSWKLDFSDIARLEWQANQFASCLLMPRKAVTELFYEYADTLKIRNRGYAPFLLMTSLVIYIHINK